MSATTLYTQNIADAFFALFILSTAKICIAIYARTVAVGALFFTLDGVYIWKAAGAFQAAYATPASSVYITMGALASISVVISLIATEHIHTKKIYPPGRDPHPLP